ncbi:MAG: deoxyribose-phosphate aldolase, partial [candidate division Zixibacteria bacterium]|nr:deoxyribose-phosphate aldolase [candidate division Zixibacteria bacterium]
MKIAIGADHGGYQLKEQIKEHIIKKGLEVDDCGTYSTESVDYPKFAYAVAKKVGEGSSKLGIIIDGAGIGSSITANKVRGVRAALCYDVSSANNSREHNDANVLSLGAGLIGAGLAKQIVDVWLSTECTVDRHKKRVAMITDIERGNPPQVSECSSCPDDVSDISGDDLRKIADRIQSMIGGTCTTTDGNIICTNGNNIFIHYGHATDIHPDTVKSMIDAGAGRIGYTPNGKDVPSDIAGYIDHTILKPEATEGQIRKLCEEAKEYNFASVCVNSCYVKFCSQLLQGTPVKVCSVVGFPLGACASDIKALETRRAIRDGAKEIDMVINVGVLKSGDDDYVFKDIRAVAEACRDGSALSKVIIEAALLTDDEKVRACQLSKNAKADYVKTSTGFGPGGATVHDVALMSEAVKEAKMGVKAAGGIKNLADAQKMIDAGATRIGASAGVKISKEAEGITISN